MRLIKIGSAPDNDIVINSQFVSSHHAELTLLDDGKIVIEDLGSKNGTFVGGQHRKLSPGQEMQITRGSAVMVANENLPWNQVPVLRNEAGQYRAVVNLGSNFRNNIVVASPTVSRYHATVKIDKNGKAWITDNGSTNGTEVNGQKISLNSPVRIKKGDNIVIGSEDVTSQLAQYFESGNGGFVKNLLIAVATILVACGVGYLVWTIWPNQQSPKNSVVYVQHSYYYTVAMDDKDNPHQLPLELTSRDMIYVTGTAFFIDKEGRMGTVNHLATPWERQFDQDNHDVYRKEWDEYLEKNLPKFNNLKDLAYSPIGFKILEALGYPNYYSEVKVKAVINAIRKAAVKITGHSADLYIAYPGRMYSSADEFERASIDAVSKDPNIDLAILQLNTKRTPEQALACYLDIENAFVNKVEPIKETLTTIGYPSGISRALDLISKSLEPTIRQTRVAKTPSRYTIELQDGSAGGSSGSPVFNKNNQLVGVISQSYFGNSATTTAVQARYLKELYYKQVK